MHLYIAYKNYSSWSLRPWIAMKVADIPFKETVLPFFHDDSLDRLGERFKIPAQVPVLEDGDEVIWDSMAILERLAEIWAHFERADKPEGDFLCGHFSIVDAMYAPVMWRIHGYGLDVSPAFQQWIDAMLALPAMQEWLSAAQAEDWVIEQYETAGETVA